MDSPQLRRTPQSSQNNPGGPIPFQIEIPQGYVPPVHSQDDPFQIVQHNGHALHLTPGIAAQLQQLPPLVPIRSVPSLNNTNQTNAQAGPGNITNQQLNVPHQNASAGPSNAPQHQNALAGPSNAPQQYSHLPPHLQAQLAALPPFPVQQRRGSRRNQGRGRGAQMQNILIKKNLVHRDPSPVQQNPVHPLPNFVHPPPDDPINPPPPDDDPINPPPDDDPADPPPSPINPPPGPGHGTPEEEDIHNEYQQQ
ncbi:hypothetical protein C8R42DRAFT_640387 [Lentinula raphanica]|nr:hypothetical protein C8R42DRAFT_640387 [Lentinula raphanica]